MTLDEVLAMTAEDVPELAQEATTLLRFRQAHAIHVSQQARYDIRAHRIAEHNRSLPKRNRIDYR